MDKMRADKLCAGHSSATYSSLGGVTVQVNVFDRGAHPFKPQLAGDVHLSWALRFTKR
ncbi:hypothetical protein GCM10023352_11330 [Rothia endophytica]|uniref:Uncharacterized protein n=1 Tax=Rothia endophytica TaxID=1324766 RepID=A0ABP9BE64_9MICC